MQPSPERRQRLDDDAFRAALRDLVTRSGRSMRSLSQAMGRDPGYVAALLDPTRPSRARPAPDDLLALSDATGIPFVELLASLWSIPIERVTTEVDRLSVGAAGIPRAEGMNDDDRLVAEFGRFLKDRRRRRQMGR